MICIAVALALLQDTAEPFFKFPVGTTWTYKRARHGHEGEAVFTVTKHDAGKVHVESKEGSKTDRHTWHIDGGFLVFSEDGRDGLRVKLYKLGSKKGDSWDGKVTHKGVEEVRVPAGTYKDAVHVQLVLGEGEESTTIDFWLVAKVGLVKFGICEGHETNTLELKEFKEGK